jgi:hypothetical protein
MAKSDTRNVTMADGSLDFSGGVNSYVTPTVQSANNPNGLRRNQLSWLDNATVRAGGITQRNGWLELGALPDAATGLYQGKFMYDPGQANPYFIYLISGNVWQVDPDNPGSAINLSAQFLGMTMPIGIPRVWFCQAEQFLVIQAGDGITLPLIWDGSLLRRSVGIINLTVPGAITPVAPTVYSLAITSLFVVPAVGSSVVVNLTVPYPGSVGDTGTLGIIGTYKVIGASGNTFTIQTVSSSYVGQTVGSSSSVNFTITNSVVPPPPPVGGYNEIPAAGPMCYYMGRLWYAQNRQYVAGDIVGGPSGTLAYQFADSVLKVTENPLAIGGDGFTVPASAGNITAIAYNANINTQLGQGLLYIFTEKEIYSLTVPVSRTDWINASATNGPMQTVVQISNGAVNDRSIVAVNGDLFFQSLEPSIRSLQISVRNFQQWNNTSIAINEQRILQFNDRSLLRFASGIEFDNRLIETALPMQTPVGVAHQALVPLNFDVISTLDQQMPPVWEGMYEGMPILELATGNFGGLQRAFATVWSELNKRIELWEITNYSRWDQGDNRVSWYIEFPAFTWGDEFAMKKLVSAELWLDKIFGEVDYWMDYRPDGDPCWYPWHEWDLCTARDQCEDVHQPCPVYPKQLRESFRQTITLPLPPNVCESVSGRPANVAYQIQCRLRIKGWCRVRGLLLKAEHVEEKLYSNMICG